MNVMVSPHCRGLQRAILGLVFMVKVRLGEMNCVSYGPQMFRGTTCVSAHYRAYLISNKLHCGLNILP